MKKKNKRQYSASTTGCNTPAVAHVLFGQEKMKREEKRRKKRGGQGGEE